MTKTIAMLTHRRALLRRCAVGVFALVLAGLPTTWLAAPAVSRPTEIARRGGPGGPGGPGVPGRH